MYSRFVSISTYVLCTCNITSPINCSPKGLTFVVFYSFHLVERIKCLMIKALICCRLFTDEYTLFMVVSIASGESRSVSRGLCTVEGYIERYFFPT
jgi:hypothetical protein